MCSGMPLKIKCIIEALATEGAQVALCIAVTFHVSVQESLQGEDLVANPAHELGRVGLWPGRRETFIIRLQCWIGRHWVLYSMTSIDQLNRHIRWDTQL